jgi:3'-phosphoadenosine 5'-phosphosulfate (PAPS) 3'-phosphatase
MTEPTIANLEVLARQAGAILHEGYEKKHDVSYKGVIDLVTEVDRVSEAFLIGEISRLFPGHSILAEESAPEHFPHFRTKGAAREGRAIGSSTPSTARSTMPTAFRSSVFRLPMRLAEESLRVRSMTRCAMRCSQPSAVVARCSTAVP